MRLPGTIKALTDGGFGFLRHPQQAKGIFFHSASLMRVAFDDLKVGDEVAFDLVEDASGKGPRADKVERDWPAQLLEELEDALQNLQADTRDSAVCKGDCIFSR